MSANLTNLSTRLKSCSDDLRDRKAEQKVLSGRAAALLDEILVLRERSAELEIAKDVLNRILVTMQSDVVHYIEQIVTDLITHVFGEQYRFVFDVSVERGKPALTPLIEKNGQQVSPKDEMGGGLMDVLSLGLRMALWSLDQQTVAPVLVLDEPGKYLDRSRVPLFGEALRQLSEQLGLQIIMVTHLDELKELADRSFTVRQQAGVSIVEGGVVNETLPETHDHSGTSGKQGTVDERPGRRRRAANKQSGRVHAD